MSYDITNQFPHPIFTALEQPCISLYQPTHRNVSESPKDIIVFKNLLKSLTEKLLSYDKNISVQAILKPLLDLQLDQPFWQNNSDGIAIFMNPNQCIIYRLPIAFEPQVHVYNNYYILPLMKHYQHHVNCDLLYLSKTEFFLANYDNGTISKVLLPEAVNTQLKDVLGDDKMSAYLAHGSYGGAGGHAMYHGHKDINQEMEKELDKFFRYVDAVVYQHQSAKTQRPLVLVALPEHQSIFRKISDNQYLLKTGIEQSTKTIDDKRLKPLINDIFNDISKQKNNQRLDQYFQAKAKHGATDHYHDIAKAARFNNIKTMFVENNRQIIGHLNINPLDGHKEPSKKVDILNAMVLYGMSQSVEIIMLDKSEMPTDNGIAIIHRFLPKAQ